MIGGNVSEVDFFLMKAMDPDAREPSEEDRVTLYLPNKETGECDVKLYVPREEEAAILNQALGHLPWTALSWSIHRGLRDILVAFAKERMDRYRSHLADSLRLVVAKWPERLDAKGWDPRFVRESMADIAASAVLADRGNSGDAVRVVTDVAMCLWGGTSSALDETTFWRYGNIMSSSILSPTIVVALVKYFVLEWSVDLDYQMYHDLPLEVYLG